MTVGQLETGLAFAVSYVGNPLSMFLAINRKPFGWWIVAVTQALFVTFAIVGHHWEFAGQALCLAMGVYGVWRWQIQRTHEPALNIPEQRQSSDDEIWRLAGDGQIWRSAGVAYEQWRIRSENRGGRAGGSVLPPWPVVCEKYPRRARQWHDMVKAALGELGNRPEWIDFHPDPRSARTVRR